jgi:hypothetical protein
MDAISGSMSLLSSQLAAAETSNKVAIAVAKKLLDAQEQQGAAMLSLLDAAAQIADPQAAGQCLDVTA